MGAALNHHARLVGAGFYVTEGQYGGGARGDGTTDDIAAFDAAINAAAAAGGGVVVVPMPPGGAYYKLSRCVIPKSNVTLVVLHDSTRIVVTGTKWPLYAALLLGGMTGANYARCPTYALNNVTQGDETATTTTAADNANMAVGDVVAVETTTSYAVGADNVPTWGQYNVVTSIGGSGSIGLRRPIQKTQTGVQLRRLSRTGLTMLNADSTDSGLTLEAVRDFALYGGTWETTIAAAPFIGTGGAVDCRIMPAFVNCATGPAYGNAFAHCTFKSTSLRPHTYAGELAWNSHNNEVSFGSATLYDNGVASARWFGFTEGARDNGVVIESLHGGNLTATNGIDFVNVQRNSLRITSLAGAAVSGVGVQFATLAYVGTYPQCEDNTFEVVQSSIASQQFYVLTTANAPRNKVKGVFRGTVTGGSAVAISGTDTELDMWCENGGVSLGGTDSSNKIRGRFGADRTVGTDYAGAFRNDIRIDTPNYRTLAALARRKTPATYTNAAPLTETITIPAATLQTGDTFQIKIRGAGSGAGGTKTITLTFAGTTLSTTTVTSGTTGTDVECTLVIVSNTDAVALTRSHVGATTATPPASVTGKNFTTTAYDLVVSITVASGGDGFTTYEAHVLPYRTQTDGLLV